MTPRALPALRVPRTDRSFVRSIAGSAALHLGVIAALVWGVGRGDLTPPSVPGGPGPLGGGGGSQRITFLTFSPPPAARPSVQAVSLPVVREIPMELPRPEPVSERVLTDVLLPPSGVRGGAGTGTGTGTGAGVGPGMGSGIGPGTGGTGGDVFPPQARYSILPPLPKPAAVRGKSFQVRFWVDASGGVTKVQVSPEIPDGAYRKKFLSLMYEYTFAPARKLDGTPVAGQTILTITL
jgi:protein TonB